MVPKKINDTSFRSGKWVHGVSYFEDGSVFPWVKLAEDALIGQTFEWCYKSKEWKRCNLGKV